MTMYLLYYNSPCQSLSVRKKLKSTTCVNEVADNLEAALNAAWLVKENLKFGR